MPNNTVAVSLIRNRTCEFDATGPPFGYARVSISTDDQDLSLQIDALEKHGVKPTFIFTDKSSAQKMTGQDYLTVWAHFPRATLMVQRLDRLGRSMPHLMTLIEDLRECGVGFRSVRDGVIDTTCAYGELNFNIFSALALFERGLIQ